MKISSLNVVAMRNEEHYQFMNDVSVIVSKHQAGNLQVQAEFDKLKQLCGEEQSLLELLNKSMATQSLAQLDEKRDKLFRGLSLAIESATYHFDPAKADVAERMAIVLNEYGNVARKTYNAESAALSKLSVEAKTIYEKDFAALGLMEWVNHLEAANNEFQQVMHQRYEETAGKAEGNMKETRAEADTAYTLLTNKLDAFMLITGDVKYTAVIKELNAAIEKYATTLAMRKGKKKANPESQIVE